jgi:hypothetical protein
MWNPIWKITEAKEDWGRGSSSRAPV